MVVASLLLFYVARRASGAPRPTRHASHALRRRYIDLEFYGTPGPTACTDLHFCQSTVDERRVLLFFSRNERFKQEMKQYDRLEKAADRPDLSSHPTA